MRCAVLGVCLALAACSAQQQPQQDSTVSDSAAGPNVGPTAAPGVAFDYNYAFRLPSRRIAAAQEAHAEACERLGVARCRITGMKYRLIGENNIEAMLAFKLDPAIARGFGRMGVAAIQSAEGTLIAAEITGTDAGAAIAQGGDLRARAAAELARIDGQLATRHGAVERAELERQRADLTTRIAAATATVAENRASLATTPMTFRYESGAAIRGFDASAPFRSAWDTAIGSTQFTLAALLGILAIFGPPALLAGLAWFGWRRLRRGWINPPPA